MTYQPTDLFLSIRAVNTPRQVLNGGPPGSSFPGWFLSLQNNEGYNSIVEKQLTVDQVVAIADKIDRLIDITPPSNAWTVTIAVQNCQTEMRKRIRQQLEIAEAQAASIPQLKKMLGE